MREVVAAVCHEMCLLYLPKILPAPGYSNLRGHVAFRHLRFPALEVTPDSCYPSASPDALMSAKRCRWQGPSANDCRMHVARDHVWIAAGSLIPLSGATSPDGRGAPAAL